MRHNKEEFMRTMKRVAAVALSVVVLMTSGVSAKAAVTDVQPAKSKEEAVEKFKEFLKILFFFYEMYYNVINV